MPASQGVIIPHTALGERPCLGTNAVVHTLLCGPIPASLGPGSGGLPALGQLSLLCTLPLQVPLPLFTPSETPGCSQGARSAWWFPPILTTKYKILITFPGQWERAVSEVQTRECAPTEAAVLEGLALGKVQEMEPSQGSSSGERMIHLLFFY